MDKPIKQVSVGACSSCAVPLCYSFDMIVLMATAQVIIILMIPESPSSSLSRVLYSFLTALLK